MRRFRPAVLLLLGSGLIAAAGIEGDWSGTLTAGAIHLRLVFHVARAADGGLSGTLDSIDQSAQGIPFSKVTENGRSISIEMKRIGATYVGEVSADGARMAGSFHQRGQDLPLTLQRGELSAQDRPQVPKKPYPYDEEEVAYDNSKAGVRLAGTLTLPRTAGLHPAVLLITGSGPQDRDEAIMGHRPFLVIADYLTRGGLAVLRVDDRGVGQSTGKFSTATTADFAGDARSGVDFLKTRKDIDPHRIGLIGHSEGAIIAPLVASESSDIAFIVMLAGSGVPGKQILLEQQYLINRAMGVPQEAAEQNREIERFILDTVMEQDSDAVAQRQIREGIEKRMAGMTADQRKAEQAMVDQIEKKIKVLMSPWLRAFLAYDPRPALEKVRVPVLAMNGALDLQVPPQQNLPAIAAALEAGGNPDYEIVKLPHLNHLFQTARTGSPAEYAQIEETFAPVALATMDEWIRRRTKE